MPAREPSSAPTGLQVKCPGCGGPARFEKSNPWRPFCGEHCRTLDLGAWASERFRIPAENPDPADDESSEPLKGRDPSL